MKSWRASVLGGADVLTLVRDRVRASTLNHDARRPFRFFLCGDPALVAELRALLLRGHDETYIPQAAAAVLETLAPLRRPTVIDTDARCVIFLGRPGDAAGARLDLLEQLKLPIYALTLDPNVAPNAPLNAPHPRETTEYIVPALDDAALRTRFFPQLIDCCKGIEIAVGRCLPALRETICIKLTRSAALSALKIAAASAMVDNVPILGIVLGAAASAGDIVAITGIQIVLMLQIGAVYGKDPDMRRIWELLPIVGGGFGWRVLAREMSGFIPVAGVAIKSAIAYAGTIVVGEGAAFYYQQGRPMTKADARRLYDEAKRTAVTITSDLIARVRKK